MNGSFACAARDRVDRCDPAAVPVALAPRASLVVKHDGIRRARVLATIESGGCVGLRARATMAGE
jgi:hypothetical protein